MKLFYLNRIFLIPVFVIVFFAFSESSIAQKTSIPSLNPGSYNNSVSFENSTDSYILSYTGEDVSIAYRYSNKNGYSLNGITTEVNGYVFNPSYFGGVSLISPGKRRYYLWSEGISSRLIKSSITGNAVISEWVVSYSDEFYFHYQYNISISGKTLIINVKDLGKIRNYPIQTYAILYSFELDRCENTLNPVMIGIPYLTAFNILYTNNYFVSLFFDWTKTNSSVIKPYDLKYSVTSVYYSQNAEYNYKTNGKKNKLDETIYLTISENIEEVFPEIPNPVAKYKSESISHLIYDNWDRGFQTILNNVKGLKEKGLDNLWLIVHNWQNGGYDNKLPDVLPANAQYGGNSVMKELSAYCISENYLFSLHENYSDFYPNAPSYKKSDLALSQNQIPVNGWKTDIAQAHLMKPSKIKNYLIPISSNIQNTFNTNSAFIDVITARSPSEYVDYDAQVIDAGKSTGSFKIICDVGEQLRKIHRGPVSGEGYHQFYYTGYYDDFASQIQTGLVSDQHLKGGYYKPLLVDFDLRKMHDKTMVHGVGYLERFFYKDSYWKYMGRSKDSVMILSATELAYGHGAFFQSNSYDFKEQGLLEYNYVYPMQLMYGNAQAVNILYNDNGNLVTLSEYIKKYPNTFDKFDSNDFLSQVFIEYDNGVTVYVNRHPRREWRVNLKGDANGWFDYHGIVNREKILYTGNSQPEDLTLPASNGWYCYSPVNPK